MREFSEAEAMKVIAELERGGEVTMVVDGQETTYRKLAEPVFCSGHYFEIEEEKDGQLFVKCKNCPNGKILDPKKHMLVEGKITRRDNGLSR